MIVNNLTIDWLYDCPRCDCGIAVIITTSRTAELLYEDDGVVCCGCGKAGFIEAVDGYAQVNWIGSNDGFMLLNKGDHAVWLKSYSRSSEVFKIDTDKSGKMGMRPASKKEIEQGFRDEN